MAKQSGQILFEGTLGNITGYQMNGKHYLKRKTEVSRKKIMTDRRYENTRRNAGYFAEAQKLASTVYQEFRRSVMYQQCNLQHGSVRRGRMQREVWYRLRNRAQQLIRKQLPKEEILNMLRKEFIKPAEVVQPIAIMNHQPMAMNHELKAMNHTPTTINHKPKTINPQQETINLGKTINPGVIYELTDQLAAYNSLVKNLLNPVSKVPAYKEEKKQFEKVLEKFRR